MKKTDDSIFLIAEVGQAHEGSLGIAYSYIDALADTGIDAVKFQVHIAEAESSSFEQFRVKFSKEDDTRFDYWKRMEFTAEQWGGLKQRCEEKGLEFLASPFSIAAVRLLEAIGVKRYKIGSGEVSNLLLLERIARTGKEVILSSGMSSYQELELSFNFLKNFDVPISILQCTTAYPTQPEEWGLNVIRELKDRFDCRVGFSDHSGTLVACLAAATLGAQILEFHTTFDRRIFGPDSTSSLTIDEIENLAKGVRQIEHAVKNPINKNQVERFSNMKIMFGKSLAVNKNLTKGHKITIDDLESKKPSEMGIAASDYNSIIGRTLIKDISCFSFLQHTDLIPNE